MSEAAADVQIIVAVDPEKFDEAARALSDAGVTVESEFRDTGTIAGTVQQDKVTSLDLLDGVLAVEQDRGSQLPPPDAELQ